ncbi:MAG: ComEC/Rec2 family competence protein [Proteobacteria bacterium]|nr:ComEC/Rec2 family competence protein [Pseudomonadota bacterium]
MFSQTLLCLLGIFITDWRAASAIILILLLLFNFPWISSLGQFPDVCTGETDTVIGVVKSDSHDNKEHIDLIKCSLFCGRLKSRVPTIRLDLRQATRQTKVSYRPGDTLEMKSLHIKKTGVFGITGTPTKQFRIYNRTSQEKTLMRSSLLIFIQAKAEYYLDGFSLAVFKALLTADRSNLSNEWKAVFKRLGVFHIFAISGMHIGILFLWLSFVLHKMVAFPNKWVIKGYGVLAGDIACIVLIVLFLNMIGMPISAKRAVLMLIWWLLVKHVFYWQPIWLILLAVALIVLMENHAVIGQLSFQLSFLSVTGILILLPLLPIPNRADSYIQKIFKPSFSTVVISLWLLLFTMPVVQQLVEQRSLLVPLNNLVHITFTSLIFLPISLIVLGFNLFTFYFGFSSGEYQLYTVVHLIGKCWEKLLTVNDTVNNLFLIDIHYDWTPYSMLSYWAFLILIVQFLKWRQRENRIKQI